MKSSQAEAEVQRMASMGCKVAQMRASAGRSGQTPIGHLRAFCLSWSSRGLSASTLTLRAAMLGARVQLLGSAKFLELMS
eukprot:1157667-Pelagomonas_calceolata.AAC.7